MDNFRQSSGRPIDALEIYSRHKKKSLLFFSVVFGGAVLFTLLAPRKYMSEGKLFVRLGRENATLDPTATLGQSSVVAVPQSRESDINSEVEILQNRALIGRVVDALGPEKIIGSGNRDKAIRQVAANLKVEAARKSSVIDVSYRGSSPELSQAVLAKLIDSYLDEHGKLNRPRGSYEFFVKQTGRLRGQLNASEAALRDLKNETGLASPSDQRKLIVARIGRLEDDLLKSEEARAVAEASVAQLRRKAAGLPDTQVQETSGFSDDGTNRMKERFYALQLRQKEAQAKYTPDHPKMREIDEQVEAARKFSKNKRPEVTSKSPARPTGSIRRPNWRCWPPSRSWPLSRRSPAS